MQVASPPVLRLALSAQVPRPEGAGPGLLPGLESVSERAFPSDFLAGFSSRPGSPGATAKGPAWAVCAGSLAPLASG